MKKPIVLVIKTGGVGSAILHCSVHEDATTAYGRAMLEMDYCMTESNDEYYFTSLYRLEADAGFGFDAVNKKDENDTLVALILDTDGEQEE